MGMTSKDELSVYYQRLLGTRIRNRYELVSFIKAGGSSGVYEGVDRVMERRVAVKVLYGTNPMMGVRFEREAITLSRLEHPNTLTVHDFGTADEGFLYMVMEYLQGRTLKDVIRLETRLGARRAVAIASQICRSLAEAHRHGVVHRDIKPSNVSLVSVDGNPEFVKVLDFGVAKVLGVGEGDEPELTQLGRIIGTPRYMSPEQISGSKLDGRADLYSLGVLLYEMLAGEVPFADPSLATMLLLHLKEAPPSFRQIGVPDVPPALEAVVMRALAKQPDDRYLTADALREALEHSVGFGGARSVADFAANELPHMVRGSQSTRSIVPEPPPVPEPPYYGAGSDEDDIALAEPADEYSLTMALPTPGANGARSAASKAAAAGSWPRPSPESAARSGAGPRDTQKGSKKPWVWAVGGATVAAAVAGVLFWQLGQKPLREASQTVASAAPREAAPVASAAPPDIEPPIARPAPTLTHRVVFQSRPPGAAVYDSGRHLGITPFEMDVDAASWKERGPWTFKLDGHVDQVEGTPPLAWREQGATPWIVELAARQSAAADDVEAGSNSEKLEEPTEEHVDPGMPPGATASALLPADAEQPPESDLDEEPLEEEVEESAPSSGRNRVSKPSGGENRRKKGSLHSTGSALDAYPTDKAAKPPWTAPGSNAAESPPKPKSDPPVPLVDSLDLPLKAAPPGTPRPDAPAIDAPPKAKPIPVPDVAPPIKPFVPLLD